MHVSYIYESTINKTARHKFKRAKGYVGGFVGRRGRDVIEL